MIDTYHARTFVPPLVAQALALAEEQGFDQSSRPEVGRLLHTLAASVRDGRIGEMGTGCGVGTAWMASALGPGGTLITVERDADRAAAAGRLFAALPNVQVLNADSTELLAHGPFDLLFVDSSGGWKATPDARGGLEGDDVLAPLLAAVRIGGLIVLDDLTPEAAWPPEWRGRPDPTRSFWLNDPRLAAVELIVDPSAGPRSAVIVASRIGG
jgi:predicted O-methyltransferase YrrM